MSEVHSFLAKSVHFEVYIASGWADQMKGMPTHSCEIFSKQSTKQQHHT